MTGFDLALGMCLLILAMYLIVCAIRYKGVIYENENFDYKSNYYQRYCKIVRGFCFGIGLCLIATFVFSLLAYIAYYKMGSGMAVDYTQEQLGVLIGTYVDMSNWGYTTRYLSLGGAIVMIIVSQFMSNIARRLHKTCIGKTNPAFDFDKPTDSNNTKGE